MHLPLHGLIIVAHILTHHQIQRIQKRIQWLSRVQIEWLLIQHAKWLLNDCLQKVRHLLGIGILEREGARPLPLLGLGVPHHEGRAARVPSQGLAAGVSFLVYLLLEGWVQLLGGCV